MAGSSRCPWPSMLTAGFTPSAWRSAGLRPSVSGPSPERDRFQPAGRQIVSSDGHEGSRQSLPRCCVRDIATLPDPLMRTVLAEQQVFSASIINRIRRGNVGTTARSRRPDPTTVPKQEAGRQSGNSSALDGCLAWSFPKQQRGCHRAPRRGAILAEHNNKVGSAAVVIWPLDTISQMSEDNLVRGRAGEHGDQCRHTQRPRDDTLKSYRD